MDEENWYLAEDGTIQIRNDEVPESDVSKSIKEVKTEEESATPTHTPRGVLLQVFLKHLGGLGPLSRHQLMRKGLSCGTLRKLVKQGVLECVEYPTITKYKVADDVIQRSE